MAGYAYFASIAVSSQIRSQALPSPQSSRAPARPSSIATECHTQRKSGSTQGNKRRVSIFWDLDNKPPKSSPYHAALHLRTLATRFGDVTDMVACANRNAFLHIPRWVQEERGITYPNPAEKYAEKNLANPSSNSKINRRDTHGVFISSLMCAICGISYPTHTELKKHARLSHRHELRNMGFKAHECVGYGLHTELLRAGFFVRMVDQRPQAADRALKRQIKHSMDNNVECICLVSDDSDFAEILKTARSKHVMTVVVGDSASLHPYADVWFHWTAVAQGKDVSGTLTEGKIEGVFVKNETE